MQFCFSVVFCNFVARSCLQEFFSVHSQSRSRGPRSLQKLSHCRSRSSALLKPFRIFFDFSNPLHRCSRITRLNRALAVRATVEHSATTLRKHEQSRSSSFSESYTNWTSHASAFSRCPWAAQLRAELRTRKLDQTSSSEGGRLTKSTNRKSPQEQLQFLSKLSNFEFDSLEFRPCLAKWRSLAHKHDGIAADQTSRLRNGVRSASEMNRLRQICEHTHPIRSAFTMGRTLCPRKVATHLSLRALEDIFFACSGTMRNSMQLICEA